MDIFSNLDLFSVGFTVAATLILGFVVFYNNRKSITNRIFLTFVVVVSLWGVVNYVFYTLTDSNAALWILRLVMFFAVWQAFFIYSFFLVFPREKYDFSRLYKIILFPLVLITSFLTLSPLILHHVAEVDKAGVITKVVNGPLIPLFGMVSVGLVAAALFLLFKKIIKGGSSIQKRPLGIILFGTFVTFLLVITFNFVFPAILNNSNFIPLGSVFFFPFIVCTAYATIKHRVLGVKVISTEILIFGLTAAILFEVVASNNLLALFYRASLFLLVLSVGILLIKSVRNEVQQREQLTRLSKSLKHANTKLKELDELKTEFMSIASHQLRTPLSIIKGYTSLMEEGAYGGVSKEEKKILHNIDISNERLIKLVDEFLNISRIEQGRIKYSFAEMDAVPMAEGVIAELKEKAAPQHVKLSLRAEEKFFKVAADEEKLRHCLYNFVDNAIKYSPDNEEVIIYLEKKNSGIAARVCDKGVGLDKDDIKNLFQKFYRSPHVLRDYQGTGLGLFVVKQFIEAHGGRVWAKSKGIGKGSEFGFWIPLRGKSERVTSERVKSEGEGV